jgi:hypothetical protein
MTLVLIMRIVRIVTKSSTKAVRAGLFWASSPFVFLVLMATTAEIYPALLLLIGVYAMKYSRVKVGSAALAFGTILRGGPGLVSWIYAVALLRSRRFTSLINFLGVQLLFILFIVAFIVFAGGWGTIVEFLAAIRIPEVLASIGSHVQNAGGYAQIGLAFPIYLLFAYFLTKPATWENRTVGAEAVGFFAAFYALTPFYPVFVLWALPVFVVYAAITRFGMRRLMWINLFGPLFYLFVSSFHLSQEGRALLFIPNMNTAMVNASAILNDVVSMRPFEEIFRSLFSAFLLLLLFWILREMRKPKAVLVTSTES